MLEEVKCKEKFLEYVNDFDTSDNMISRKIAHSLRVADISKDIASSLELSDEDVKLAYIIGVLHDIGRFKQVTECRNYSDKLGLGHAKIGDIVLFEENKIVDFVETREYDAIIRQAVLNHSFFKINDDVDGKELVFAKIIRDADKLDIFNLFTFDNPIQMGIDSGYFDNDLYTEKVLTEFYNGKQVEKNNLNTLLDWFINMIGFVFDLNYKKTFEILHEEKYINKIFNRMKEIKKENTDIVKILEDMEKYINRYIENKKVGI